MKAKDTVMSYESIEQMQHTTNAGWVDKGRNIAEAQAEISFKAGEEQGIRKAIDNLKMHYCIIDVEARIKEIEGESDRTNRRTG